MSLSEFVKTPAAKGSTKRSLSDSALNRTVHADKLTREEVAKHDSKEDAWVIIKNRVYDVTSFGLVHPGGEVIFTHAGRDATEVFACFHAATTWNQLNKLYIGDICEDNETDSLLEDFRKLRADLVKDGMFASDKMFYCWKLSLNLAILVTSVGLLATDSSWMSLLLAAFLLGLFFQQSGWLAHDFCHHQVFRDRRVNNVFGYLIGNVMQGFSVQWWKFKHNTHHAVTNEIDQAHLAVDPDIDTLPLLAWSEDMLSTLSSPNERSLIRFQHYLFFPVLLFARFSWAQQSFSHGLNLFLSGDGNLEFALIVIHYAWHFGIAFLTLPWMKAIAFLFIAQCLSGFMLGFAFVQSHNGMEIYGDAKDFVTAQIISTRDISYSIFVDFFMGGLNYQIEHHLFPTMPRHNLRKAQVAVKALCAKHGLPYEECSMATGTRRVIQRLVDVAKHA